MPKQRSSSKNEKEMKETYRSFSSKNEMELNLSVDFKCTNVYTLGYSGRNGSLINDGFRSEPSLLLKAQLKPVVKK